jgi:glycine hydroxymethyltransferase
VQEEDFREIGDVIARALQPGFDEARAELADRVAAIADRYPLYPQLGAPAAVA